jgi:hypothetical protein
MDDVSAIAVVHVHHLVVVGALGGLADAGLKRIAGAFGARRKPAARLARGAVTERFVFERAFQTAD